MKSILDPKFRYTPSHSTDLGKRFDEIRRAQKKADKKRAESETNKVTTLIVPARS